MSKAGEPKPSWDRKARLQFTRGSLTRLIHLHDQAETEYPGEAKKWDYRFYGLAVGNVGIGWIRRMIRK